MSRRPSARLRRTLPLLAGLLCALAGALSAGAPPAAAQERVTVSTERAAGLDRLVLRFAEPTPYSIGFEGSDLVIALERPADFVLGALGETLSGLAGAPRIEAEGRRLVLPFAGRRALTHFQLGDRLVVDLGRHGNAPRTSERMPAVGDPSGGPAPGDAGPGDPAARRSPASPGGKPAVAARPTPAPRPVPTAVPAPSAGLPVLLRVGVHEEYDRLVFDWPKPVDFELEETALGATRVRFAEAGRLEASVLERTRVARLQRLTATDGEDGLAVDLVFPSGVTARAFALDRRIVVDLAGPKGPLRRAAVELRDRPRAPIAAPPVAAPPPKPAAVEPAGQGRPVPLFPQGPAGDAQTAGDPKSAGEAKDEAPPTPLPDAGQRSAARTEEAPPARLPPPPRPPGGGSTGFEIERTDVFGRRVATPQPGGTAPWPEPVVLRFDWPSPTRAAVLQSGPAVLLVFDAVAPDWAMRRLAALAPELRELERHELERATAFSFEVSTLVSPLLRREGSSWILDLRPRPALLDQPLPLEAVPSAGAVRLSTEDAGPAIALVDPATGGRLYAVPFGENAGFAPARRFPQFEILASPQGLFVAPLSDRVTVDSRPRRVTVAGIDARALAGRAPALGEPTGGERGRRLFDPVAWRLEASGDYSAVRQELQTDVATSRTATELIAARLALARFYFGHGLAQETLGQLEVIFADQPALIRDPELLLMAGASQALAGDYEAAVATLGDPALVGEPEAWLWQGLLAAAAQDWPVAADRFAARLPLAADYARAVRVRFALAAAEARMEVGDTAGAFDRLEQVERELRSDLERARHGLISGMTLLADGQVTKAERLLGRVAGGGYGSASARARLLMIERALADGGLGRTEAIEEIERLRFAWRGDAFEFALLRRLADLYEAEGRIRPALRSLRAAVSNFPGNPGAEPAALRMQALFAELFTGAEAARLAPLAGLSLFDEFRELTPPGPQGDAIIESLADRLVEIDLLGRAAELLDQQLRERLHGLEQSRVGARLALVRLLDRKPAEALAALDASGAEPVPEGLRHERARLRAKALVDLGRTDEALDVLAGDDSAEADRLRIEIDRAAGRWSAVAAALARRLPPAGLPLDEAAAASVVQAAVANVLADQHAELQHLARSYGEAMAATGHAETFRLLAGAGDALALASISEQLGQVEHAQAFMSDYRERLAEGALSALN